MEGVTLDDFTFVVLLISMSGLVWLGDCVACGIFRLSVFAYALLVALHSFEVCLMKRKI